MMASYWQLKRGAVLSRSVLWLVDEGAKARKESMLLLQYKSNSPGYIIHKGAVSK
jgi:hypothetical protein